MFGESSVLAEQPALLEIEQLHFLGKITKILRVTLDGLLSGSEVSASHPHSLVSSPYITHLSLSLLCTQTIRLPLRTSTFFLVVATLHLILVLYTPSFYHIDSSRTYILSTIPHTPIKTALLLPPSSSLILNIYIYSIIYPL